MRALVWDGERLRFVRTAPAPHARAGEALVRVRRAGICSTDLEIARGYLGFRGIPGHEMVGEVEAGPERLLGRRVVAEINLACGRCPSCAAGRPRHCPSRSVLGIAGADGAFAELVRVPAGNLHLVPAAIPDRQAVFVEPLAAAFEAELQSRSYAGGATVVLGAGKLGLLVAQVLARRGDRVTVLARSEAGRLRAERLGLRAAPRAEVGRGADLVVEATGSIEGLPIALELVRPLGAVVLKSTVAAEHRLDLAPVVIDEVTLIGSRCGPFEPALEALAAGDVRVEPLIEAELPLERGEEALRRAGEPGAGKVLLEP